LEEDRKGKSGGENIKYNRSKKPYPLSIRDPMNSIKYTVNV
jgi:hypothetical protein